MVATWCMCCVCEANAFRKKHYRRIDEGQFTKVCCKTNILKQCIIVFCEESLSMMIGRAAGWMEWSGLVKGRAGGGKGRGVVTVPF